MAALRPCRPDASVATAPPPLGTFMTEPVAGPGMPPSPPVGMLQYTLVESTATGPTAPSPDASVTRQRSPVHVPPHATPQPPQWAASVCSSTQTPPQIAPGG